VSFFLFRDGTFYLDHVPSQLDLLALDVVQARCNIIQGVLQLLVFCIELMDLLVQLADRLLDPSGVRFDLLGEGLEF
jgi:hypothetical protein